MAQVPLIELSYAPARTRRWRRVICRSVIALLMMAFAAVSYHRWGHSYYLQARYLFETQRPLANFRSPPDTIAVETDGARAAALVAADPVNYHLARWLYFHPDPAPKGWQPLAVYVTPRFKHIGLTPGDRSETHGLLFAHQRTAPNGSKRLVLITAERTRTDYDDESIIFRATTFSLAGWRPGSRPRQLSVQDFPPSLVANPEFGLQLFIGEPDPQDPSRFTIPCAVHGKRGLIHGWLEDKDMPTGYHDMRGPVRLETEGTPLAEVDFFASLARRQRDRAARHGG